LKKLQIQTVLALALIVPASVVAAKSDSPQADAEHLPFPEKLINARTVFIQNDSGDSKLGDAMYKTLRSWGRWKIVAERSEADIVAVVDHKDIFIQNNFTLTLLDTKSSERLWSAKHDAAFNARGIISRELTSDLRKRLPAVSAR
jgi:hypothetical protein